MKEIKPSMFNIFVPLEDGKGLLYNPLGKRPLIVCPEQTYKEVFEQAASEEPEISWEQLKKLGYMVPEEKEEMEEFLAVRRKFMYNRNPKLLQVLLALTMRCNYKCIYCFEEGACKEARLTKEDMDDICMAIIRQAEANPECKEVNLLHFGGEPTLMTAEICSLGRKLKGHLEPLGIRISSTMVTNGYLLDRKTCEQLKRDVNLELVQITVDGLKDTYMKMKRPPKDAFERVLSNIRDVSELVEVNLRINVDCSNQEECRQLYAYLMNERGLRGKVRIYFAKVYDSEDENNLTLAEYNAFLREMLDMIYENGDIENLSYYIPKIRVTQCAAMQQEFLCIGPDKKRYRCEHELGHPEYAIGDIYSGRQETEHEKAFMDDRIPDKCRECPYFPLCLHGCSHDRLVRGLSIDCEAMKERIHLDILALYYQKMLERRKEK